MKYELKRVSIWSAVKITFVLYLIMGFLIGILYAFFMMLIAVPLGMMNNEASDALSAFTGVLALLLPFIFGFLYAIFGTIMSAIMVWLYNMICKLVGGLEMELVEVAPTPQPMAVQPPVPPPPPPPHYKPESENPDYTT